MKYLAVVLIALTAVAAADEEWKPAATTRDLAVFLEECGKLVPLSKEQIEQMESFKFPDEKEIREFAVCVVKKMGLFSEESDFNRDRFTQQINAFERGQLEWHEHVLPGLLNCLDTKVESEDTGVRIYQTLKCMANHLYEMKRQHQLEKNMDKSLVTGGSSEESAEKM